MKKQIVKNLPDLPGVYKMLNAENKIIYVGKAKNLRKRVLNYFQKDYAHSTRTKKLLENAKNIECIVTDSELEAYILETNLIKGIRPKYNILMKDDKNFLYIRIDLNEDFPRIRITRNPEKNSALVRRRIPAGRGGKGVKYIGPKTNTTQIHETFRVLKKVLPFRHCNLDIEWINKNPSTEDKEHPKNVKVSNKVIDFPCLDYFIKRCPGPCVGAISPIAYKKFIQKAIDFLEGNGEKLIGKLKNDMVSAAANKKFEQAARIRDKIAALQKMMDHQKASDPERIDTDIVNFIVEASKVFLTLFKIRRGKLIDTENFILDAFDLSSEKAENSEILEAFLKQYYELAGDLPKEILIPEEEEWKELFSDWLLKKRELKVKIIAPKKGEKNKLLELCSKNAENYAKQCRIKWMAEKAQQGALKQLAEISGLKGNPLKRIECFDISHVGGSDTVGAMVVFENGYPKKDHYRHFTLRTIRNKPNDFASMKEILLRRLKYISQKKDPEISIKAATKKDLDEIKKELEEQYRTIEGLNRKDCVVAKRKNKIIAFGRLHELNDKITEISGLWVDPKERGKRLGCDILSLLVNRAKPKRIYIDTVKSLEQYFAVFGFTTLKQTPEILIKKVQEIHQWLKAHNKPLPKEKIIYMVYDKTKHKTDLSYASKPNLIIIDGGKSQMSAALQALSAYNLNIPIIALAKKNEEIYMPGKTAPILLDNGSEALKLLQRVRDEAHRFAITFQRKIHRRNMME